MFVAGSTIGWCAHRAYLRIDAWGKAMNAQDDIFREVTEEEIDCALQRVKVLSFDGASHSPLHAKPASAK